MLPVPRTTIEDQSIHGLTCAICGRAALAVVHLGTFPDYVQCASCSSAFVMEAEGDRVMYGSISSGYPETSRFALQEWTWLEAIERRAKSERDEAAHPEAEPEALAGVEPYEGAAEEPSRRPAAPPEAVPGAAAPAQESLAIREAESEAEPPRTEAGEWIDQPPGISQEPAPPGVEFEEAKPEPVADQPVDLDQSPKEAAEPEGLLTSQRLEDWIPPADDFPLQEADLLSDQDREPEMATTTTLDGEIPSALEPEPDLLAAWTGEPGEAEALSELPGPQQADLEPEAIGQPADESELAPFESPLRTGVGQMQDFEPFEGKGQAPDTLDAVFSDDWLDGVAEPVPLDESESRAAVEDLQPKVPEGWTGMPLEPEPSEFEADERPLAGEEHTEPDPTAWLEDHAGLDDEADQPSLGARQPAEPDHPGLIFIEGSQPYEEPDFEPDRSWLQESPPKRESVVIGGIEVTEDFEDYAGSLPFEETGGIAEHVQLDGVSEQHKRTPEPGARPSKERPGEREAVLKAASGADGAPLEHEEPPAGIRHRVLLRSPRANIPFGICAHCTRSPATNELIILDPWASQEPGQKDRGYTLFLCPACFKRARSPGDEERNARITAYLISALVALTVIVLAVIVGLVNFRENPLVDAVILVILGIIGFMIPAVILLNRASRFPPSADAAYVRSTLFIPAREDEAEVAFEWRNQEFAQRFAESNYELLLGEVSEIADQAPGLRDS